MQATSNLGHVHTDPTQHGFGGEALSNLGRQSGIIDLYRTFMFQQIERRHYRQPQGKGEYWQGHDESSQSVNALWLPRTFRSLTGDLCLRILFSLPEPLVFRLESKRFRVMADRFLVHSLLEID